MTTCPRCAIGPLDAGAVAERLGVRVDTVHKWRWRQILPGEDGLVSGQPWWWPATIDAWARQTGRDKAPASG